MKSMKQRIVELCLVLMLANGVVLAQQSKTVISPAKANSATTNSSRTNPEDPQVLRKQQLLIFQEYILTRTLESIKDMDEVALRLSARNQILTYLSADKTPSEENKALATKVASDALADFSGHADEVPPSMEYLLGDLGAWIQKYEPKLSEKFQAAKKMINRKSGDIRALLELRGGDTLAAQRITQILDEGHDIDGLVFYLTDLMERNSKELETVLSKIVAVSERGPNPSIETLDSVSQIYLSPQISKTIKQRFLSMVIARTQPANFIGEPPPKVAYYLLTRVLPAIRELIPELYGQALTQSFALHASFSGSELASEARAKRLREGLNPIEDLVAEAEAAKSKADRNDLLKEAAQMALEKKKLTLCLEIVAKLDLEVAISLPNFWRNWTDQFLKDFVKAALATKDTELAEKGAGRMTSPLARVEALVLIMRYSGKANDKTTAQRLLAEARKIADASSDNVEKAKAFFLLSITCDIADESQRAGLLESGIRVLNNLLKPTSSGNEKEAYQEYVRSLDNAGNELRKSFKGLTRKDENGAIALAERLRKPDLKTFAMIGILQGLDELITAAKK